MEPATQTLPKTRKRKTERGITRAFRVPRWLDDRVNQLKNQTDTTFSKVFVESLRCGVRLQQFERRVRQSARMNSGLYATPDDFREEFSPSFGRRSREAAMLDPRLPFDDAVRKMVAELFATWYATPADRQDAEAERILAIEFFAPRDQLAGQELLPFDRTKAVEDAAK